MTERIDVNRLKVASPCPTTWDSMQGDERVRFCNLCQKNVYNLEQLTQAQIEQIISENENGFCGRLAMREDGTVITNDCPVGLRRLRERWQRLCVAVSSLVAMFLGAPTSAGEKKSSEEAKQNSHIPTQAISLPTQ